VCTVHTVHVLRVIEYNYINVSVNVVFYYWTHTQIWYVLFNEEFRYCKYTVKQMYVNEVNLGHL